MRDDYRERMEIWFKTLLLFVGFNKVDPYRQLMNTTCLELAKPSNKHLRLSCNDSSIYHCLLNGNNTNEFEICKNWKWIPGDAACYVKKNANSKARQVRNTTCLELARPSNQQFRLSCNNIGTYHCLLDQNYTNEFEICKMWKWIPKGKCAYYSMYSGDNIDERNCTSSSHFVCPEQKYRSENTTNYSACYIRNNPTTVQPLTSLSPVSSNWTASDGNGGNASSSRTSENAEKHIEIKSHPLPSILGIIVPVVSIAVICFILYILRGNAAESQESNDTARNNGNIEQQPFLEDTMTEPRRNVADHAESQESSYVLIKNEETPEMDITSENSFTMEHEHENNLPESRLNDDLMDESDVSKQFEDVSTPNARKTQRKYKLLDNGKEEEKKGKSADSTPGSCSVKHEGL
ncbi:uncharacterized protein [Magallana gigas]|uniref:uncharacterized protein isoform X2 n=1 Tax=Magallana gigas TaxID=29159 RepID=UPI003340C82C